MLKFVLLALAVVGVIVLAIGFLIVRSMMRHSKPLVSIAVLLREVPDLNEELVGQAVERALGVTMSPGDDPDAVVDYHVAGRPPSILIKAAPYMFLLHVRDEPYLSPREEAAEHPPTAHSRRKS